MKITIAEPVLINEVEQFKPIIAEETRKKLSEIFADVPNNEGGVPPESKDVLKQIKLDVQARCAERMQRYAAHKDDREHMLRVLGAAARVASIPVDTTLTRTESYQVEYAFQWAKAYLFREKLPMPDTHLGISVAALIYPRGTCGYTDIYLSDIGIRATKLLATLGGSIPSAVNQLVGVREFNRDEQYPVTYDRAELIGTCNLYDGMAGTVYTEDGVAWFAGFLNLEDFGKLRFRRMRLGAAVKEITGDDAAARKAADIRDLNTYDIVLHPNDRPFGDEYVRMRRDGECLDSCMSHSITSYDAPYDVHPCDVYSCAHYGQGDNGLVLVEALSGDTPVGRGIMNVHTKQIVRWYGEYKAAVMLRNTFDIEVDTDALDDVQLALIQDGNKIAAPYLDGCNTADIEDDALFVRYSGDIEMDDTSGYQWVGQRERDVCTGDYYSIDDLVYQPFHDTYYHPDNTDGAVFCPITDEYCDSYDTTRTLVNGEETRISDVVCMNAPGAWEFLGDDIGWTENADDYTYDHVDECWYTNEYYEQLVVEREAGEDKDEAA